MNVAYKHLDAKLRIAELTIGQWLGIFVGVVAGLGYMMYLHPLGTSFTLMTGVYVGGVPICAVFLANISEFNLWILVRSACAWVRSDGRYRAGAGADTEGYRVSVDGDGSPDGRAGGPDLNLLDLWSDE